MRDLPDRATADDAEGGLAGRILAGDRRAEAELVTRFQRGVAVILRRTGVERASLDDLVQETLHLALLRIREGALREAAQLPGFVAGLARNLALESIRRRQSRARLELAAAEGEHRPSTGPGALERLVEEEEARLVRRVIGELGTGRDREVLRRIYLEGDDRDRICRDLGLTRLQLNRVLFRARERYRALYEEARKGSS